MRYKLSVLFGAVVLALAWPVFGGVGSAAASPVTAPVAAPLLTPTPTLTCPPVLPLSASVAAITTTSVTIRYSIFLSPPCGYDPPVTATLFASQTDAQQWLNPVAEAVSGPERSGEVTIAGLTPDTQYWARFTAGGQRDPYLSVPVRTAEVPVCAATIKIDNEWSGGFVATVSVLNVGNEALNGWYVSWRWPGNEQIQGLWNAVAQGSGAAVKVGNAPYNATLPPGGSTTFGMVVAADEPPTSLGLTCGR